MGYPPAAGVMRRLGRVVRRTRHRARVGADHRREVRVARRRAIGAATATFGLIAGGLLGRPLGHRLIARHRLSGKDAEELTVGVRYDEETRPKLDANGLLATVSGHRDRQSPSRTS